MSTKICCDRCGASTPALPAPTALALSGWVNVKAFYVNSNGRAARGFNRSWNPTDDSDFAILCPDCGKALEEFMGPAAGGADARGAA